MPASDRTRLATSPSLTARINGMPPATAASKPSATPARRPSKPMRTSLARLTIRLSPVRSAAQLLEPAQRLADPLLVLDEREPHVALAVLAEADARRHGHLGLLDQELGELERAQAAEGIGNGSPHEHRALRLGHVPAELVEPVHQDVPALSMKLDDLVDALLVALERDNAGDLDRLEGAVVQVRLDAGQHGDHSGVAADEAETPAGHVVRLRGREDLDADVARARHLEEGRRPIAVEREVGVREIVDDHEAMLACELDDLHEEVAVHAHCRRVVREGEDQ